MVCLKSPQILTVPSGLRTGTTGVAQSEHSFFFQHAGEVHNDTKVNTRTHEVSHVIDKVLHHM